MSGGTFNYANDRIRDIANTYAHELRVARSGLSEATVHRLEAGLLVLLEANVYARRADWLFAFDDGEEAYARRLAEGLAEARRTWEDMVNRSRKPIEVEVKPGDPEEFVKYDGWSSGTLGRWYTDTAGKLVYGRPPEVKP